MTYYQLYQELSKRYPVELRCEWDNDGMMCTDNINSEVNNILIALDVTKKTVDYAIDNRYDTIISHHPLVFRSQKSMTPLCFTQEKLIKLIKNGIKVMSFHTRLDAATGGVNDTLCTLIGLKNVATDILDPIGRIGEFDSQIELSVFAKNIKNILSAPFVSFSGNKMVKKVYVVGGDGKDLISNAISCGADTLLTGQASYNTMVDAEDMGLNIVEAGHFFTEYPVCETLKKDLTEILGEKVNIDIFNSNLVKTV